MTVTTPRREDDPPTRDLIVTTLRDGGYDVRSAGDGAEGISTLSRWRPDVIVLDLRMPVMDGWAFRRAQQELDGFGAIPTIIVSGNERPSAAKLGAAWFLAKPFDQADLRHLAETGRAAAT